MAKEKKKDLINSIITILCVYKRQRKERVRVCVLCSDFAQ